MSKPCISLSAASLLLASACGSDGASQTAVDADAGEVNATEYDAGAASASQDAALGGNEARTSDMPSGTAAASDNELDFPNSFSWNTEQFEVAAGKERYLCFASTLEEDLVVDGFSTRGQPFVHHLIFSRSRGQDKLGFEECNEAFRSSWEPLFISGAGSVKLEFPQDAGHKLAKGTRLVVQMHLLNTSDQPVTGAVDIKMRRSSHPSPRPVSSYIFGTAAVKLPPQQKTELKGECKAREPVQLIAGFPHMHLLGTSMRFEVGSSPETMREVFKRDPYNFDSQTIEPLQVEIAPGDLARVTCNFNNTLTQEVTYGESTTNEMCYFIGFALDRAQQGACLEVAPSRL